MRRLLVILACVSALGALVGTTLSAFSDEASNSGNSFTAAATFPCSNPGTQTVTASDDAYIDQNSAGTNFGNAATLSVQSRNASRNRRALVRFSLPSIPSNCTLTTATLRLNASAAAAGRTLQAQRVTSSWTETGVTWNLVPTVTTTGQATVASGAGWRQWTVTTPVQAMYSGNNYGFMVRDSSDNQGGAGALQTFSSRTGANPPELVLTFG
jgi:large repetitive protein